MFRFALTRIVMALPTLLIVAVSVFVLIRLIPGDRAQLMLGDLATPASLADLRARPARLMIVLYPNQNNFIGSTSRNPLKRVVLRS